MSNCVDCGVNIYSGYKRCNKCFQISRKKKDEYDLKIEIDNIPYHQMDSLVGYIKHLESNCTMSISNLEVIEL